MDCKCITSPEQQWRELFRLQYPFETIPDIFEDNRLDNVSVDSAFPFAHELDAFAVSEWPDLMFTDNRLSDAGEQVIELPDNAAADTVHVDRSFMNDMQAVRQRVQILEQRMSQPTERESDLEMVLGNVWQALVRSGSADALPDSPIWRLVQRFARNILSTTPASTLAVQTVANPHPNPSAPLTTFSSDDWASLFDESAMPGPSRGIRSDSGYHTGL